jgi:hypothetical protein
LWIGEDINQVQKEEGNETVTNFHGLKMRAWDRQKCGPALAMCVEAPFCLDFLFLFHLRKKKEEKKENV